MYTSQASAELLQTSGIIGVVTEPRQTELLLVLGTANLFGYPFNPLLYEQKQRFSKLYADSG
jgi:hypothetical protein